MPASEYHIVAYIPGTPVVGYEPGPQPANCFCSEWSTFLAAMVDCESLSQSSLPQVRSEEHCALRSHAPRVFGEGYSSLCCMHASGFDFPLQVVHACPVISNNTFHSDAWKVFGAGNVVRYTRASGLIAVYTCAVMSNNIQQ